MRSRYVLNEHKKCNLVLPFATITLQGLYPKTRVILSINKSFFMLRNPETKYKAFNDVQITHQLTTSSVNCIEYM